MQVLNSALPSQRVRSLPFENTSQRFQCPIRLELRHELPSHRLPNSTAIRRNRLSDFPRPLQPGPQDRLSGFPRILGNVRKRQKRSRIQSLAISLEKEQTDFMWYLGGKIRAPILLALCFAVWASAVPAATDIRQDRVNASLADMGHGGAADGHAETTTCCGSAECMTDADAAACAAACGGENGLALSAVPAPGPRQLKLSQCHRPPAMEMPSPLRPMAAWFSRDGPKSGNHQFLLTTRIRC